MDTVHLQKQLQMYIRTKGLSVIARLHCIGIITHNVIKKILKSQLIWVCSKIGIYLYSSNEIRKTQERAPKHHLSKFEQSVIVNLMPIC